MIDDRGFEIGFRIAGLFRKAEEFQDERLLENIFRLIDDLPFLRKLSNAVLVAAQGQAFIKTAVELALEFTN